MMVKNNIHNDNDGDISIISITQKSSSHIARSDYSKNSNHSGKNNFANSGDCTLNDFIPSNSSNGLNRIKKYQYQQEEEDISYDKYEDEREYYKNKYMDQRRRKLPFEHKKFLNSKNGFSQQQQRQQYAPPPLKRVVVPSNIEFSEEQKLVMKYVVDDGESIFYTGNAGKPYMIVINIIIVIASFYFS